MLDPMIVQRTFLLFLFVSIQGCAKPKIAGAPQETSPIQVTADPADDDPDTVESRGHEREQHVRREQVFEARAGLERDVAAREGKPEVKRQLLKEADGLSSMARKEHELLGVSK
jgi:hypothetical protein